MKRLFIFLTICAFFSCSNGDDTIPATALRKETFHFFSSDHDKDHFLLEFRLDDSGSKAYYSYSDILSGSLRLTISEKTGEKEYSHTWAVSNCFTMADNHYLSEEEKIKKFMTVIDHFFDSTRFSRIHELKITGILKSADSLLLEEIASDHSSIGFSFIQEDFCVMYSRKSHQAVLLRALRKDLLEKYNLL